MIIYLVRGKVTEDTEGRFGKKWGYGSSNRRGSHAHIVRNIGDDTNGSVLGQCPTECHVAPAIMLCVFIHRWKDGYRKEYWVICAHTHWFLEHLFLAHARASGLIGTCSRCSVTVTRRNSACAITTALPASPRPQTPPDCTAKALDEGESMKLLGGRILHSYDTWRAQATFLTWIILFRVAWTALTVKQKSWVLNSHAHCIVKILVRLASQDLQINHSPSQLCFPGAVPCLDALPHLVG